MNYAIAAQNIELMKILFISYDGMTDPLGQSQVLPYLTNLSDMGFQITILSAEKKENYTQRKKIIQEIVEKHHLEWQHIFYTKKPPVISTLKDIRQLKMKAMQLHKTQKFDVIHCRSYIAALVGLSLKRRFGLKFIFDMRGFWADERVDGGLWNLKNPLFRSVYHYFKKKEKQFLENADYTVSLTENAKNEIQSWKLPKLSPIEVIPCCVDTNLFQPLQAENHKPYQICYLGSLGTWYMLDEMLLFFQRMLLHKPFARFLFITTDNPAMILEKANQLQIPLKQIEIRKAERREVPELLAQCQASIFFVKPAYSKKASSPTKMGEILAMGLPMIANEGIGDNSFLFEKYPCGFLLSDFSNKSIDDALINWDKLLQISPQVLREAAQDYFSLEKGVKLYASIYEKFAIQKRT